MKKIKSFIALTAIITLCINGNLTSSAYYINYSQGHSPIPDSIEYYYDFSTETVQALKNACSEWNSADSNRNFCMWANPIPILPLFIIIKLIKSPVENEELTLI